MRGQWTIALVLLAACGDGAERAPDAAGGADGGNSADASSPLALVGTWGGLGVEPGQFVEPSSIELDTDGFVYVAGHEDRLQKFTADGELVAIWGTSGAGPGQFNHPHGLALDRARGDVVYVGDQENHRIQVFTRDGTFVRLWTDPQFQHIHDVGIDPGSGDVYIGDYEADVLQRFTANGEFVAELGGTGTEPGRFDGVWGVSTDRAGNVYVADTFNRRVQKLDSDGRFLDEWSDFGGQAFTKPTGVFVDAADIVHVCDSVAETVARFDTAGNYLGSWYLRDIVGERTEPEDIVIDAAGTHIYVAEVRNHRVYHLARR